ncbi:ankyrin repeat-containing domain protein [Hypoxylon sp. NC0597]|nr:ankyrin repeat-containing domain protein [Hypoxylon sp. NC0597]
MDESQKEALMVLENSMTPSQIDETIMKVDANGKTILHHAVECGRKDAVNRLLENVRWKDMINKKDKEGKTPLHICCDKENFNREIAASLLAHGADVNAADQWGWVPLHVADREDIVDLLLTRGRPGEIDLDCRTSFRGATPLHMAARRPPDCGIAFE